MPTRLDDFDGSDADYIEYLERELSSLRKQVSQGPTRSSSGAISQIDTTSRDTSALEHVTLADSSHRQPPKLTDGIQSDLEIRTYQPIQNQPTKRKRSPSRPSPWKDHADKLLSKVPVRTRWIHAMSDGGIAEALQSGSAVRYILGQEVQMAPLKTVNTFHSPGSGISLFDRLSACATLASSRRCEASVVLMLANFQTFVVLSACAVALDHKSIPKDRIYDLVRLALGKHGDEIFCIRKLETARYLNRLINSLGENGWRGRAAELVLYWNQPLSYYFHLARAPAASRSYLEATLCQSRFVTEADGWSQYSLFVPSLVAQMLNQEIHIALICNYLGYAHAHLFVDDLEVVNPLRMS